MHPRRFLSGRTFVLSGLMVAVLGFAVAGEALAVDQPNNNPRSRAAAKPAATPKAAPKLRAAPKTNPAVANPAAANPGRAATQTNPTTGTVRPGANALRNPAAAGNQQLHQQGT